MEESGGVSMEREYSLLFLFRKAEVGEKEALIFSRLLQLLLGKSVVFFLLFRVASSYASFL